MWTCSRDPFHPAFLGIDCDPRPDEQFPGITPAAQVISRDFVSNVFTGSMFRFQRQTDTPPDDFQRQNLGLSAAMGPNQGPSLPDSENKTQPLWHVQRGGTLFQCRSLCKAFWWVDIPKQTARVLWSSSNFGNSSKNMLVYPGRSPGKKLLEHCQRVMKCI